MYNGSVPVRRCRCNPHQINGFRSLSAYEKRLSKDDGVRAVIKGLEAYNAEKISNGPRRSMARLRVERLEFCIAVGNTIYEKAKKKKFEREIGTGTEKLRHF